MACHAGHPEDSVDGQYWTWLFIQWVKIIHYQAIPCGDAGQNSCTVIVLEGEREGERDRHLRYGHEG